MTQYFGKYRGKVNNTTDTEKMGRIQVSCPFVLGTNALAWAMPCVPFAGIAEGFFMPPTVGSNVWVEFEQGDINRPIWSGGFWGPQQMPPHVVSPTTRTIKTQTIELTFDDATGVKLEVIPPTAPMPCSISLNATGIEISIGAATITLDGVKVNVNNGAMEVM